MAVFRGTGGDDSLTGTSGNDNFLLWQGGNDTVDGGGGNDVFRMGAALNAGDKIDGGTGNDVITLDGDYSAGVIFNADTIANIEIMGLAGGHSYNLTLNDGNVAAGERLLVKAQTLGAGDQLTFDGSAETDGKFYIIAGAGNDTLTGGARHDVFDLSHGGTDTVHGGGGNDTFIFGTAFGVSDIVDGGAGSDTLALNGDYSLNFAPTTIKGIETIMLAAGHAYNLSTSDDNVAAGETLKIDGSALGTFDTFNFVGIPETDGSFYIVSHTGRGLLMGGGGNDTFDLGAEALSTDYILDGGAGNDTVILDGVYAPGSDISPLAIDSIESVKLAAGNNYNLRDSGPTPVGNIDASSLGAGDHLTFDSSTSFGGVTIRSGAGADHLSVDSTAANTFVYEGVALSGDTRDTITDFTNKDLIVFHTVNSVDLVFGGTLDNANFDSELASDIGSAQLQAGDAVVFRPNSGDLAFDNFLIVDGNGVAGYQAGSDLVIELGSGFSSSLTSVNFIG